MSGQVWAVMMVKDEADVIAYNIAHLFASGIDGMLVADNLSTDGTRALLGKLARRAPRCFVKSDDEVGYFQSRKMTALADAAYDLGAEWVLPLDADELLYATEDETLMDYLQREAAEVIAVPLLNYFATAKDKPHDANPFTRERWRKRAPNPLNKVAVRWQPGMVLEPGNHHVSRNGQWLPESVTSHLGIGHFQNRSPAHLIRKVRNEARAYAETGLDPRIGYWWKFDHLADAELKAWWRRDYFFSNPAAQGLVEDPAPYRGGKQ